MSYFNGYGDSNLHLRDARLDVEQADAGDVL